MYVFHVRPSGWIVAGAYRSASSPPNPIMKLNIVGAALVLATASYAAAPSYTHGKPGGGGRASRALSKRLQAAITEDGYGNARAQMGLQHRKNVDRRGRTG